jgi:hypothetical protein
MCGKSRCGESQCSGEGYNFLSKLVQFPIHCILLYFVLYSAVFLKNFGNTLYSAVFRKCRIWANMPFCILSVFLNNERMVRCCAGFLGSPFFVFSLIPLFLILHTAYSQH